MGKKVVLFCSLLGAMAALTFTGCKSASQEDWTMALIERQDSGSIAWNVHADGTVKALLKTPDDKPITANVKGKITTNDGAAVELVQDAQSGILEGKGLKLSAGLTQAKYDLTVDGSPLTGTLFLPAGGTADIVAGARASANVKLPEPKIGVHGGTLQVVGGDVVELVANAQAHELRAYLFDAQLKAVAAADREIQVGIVAERPELVILTAEPGAAYFTGKLAATIDPIEVTIGVKTKGHAEIALVGFQPGVAMAIGATAPRVKLMVRAAVEAPAADVAAHADVKADTKAAADLGANVKTGLDLKAPTVNANAAAGANPAAQAGAGVAAGAGAKAGAGLSAGANAGAGISAGAGVKAGADTKAAAGADTSKKAQTGAKVQVKLP
jgi:hypothetical protein